MQTVLANQQNSLNKLLELSKQDRLLQLIQTKDTLNINKDGDNAELFSQKFNRNFEKCKIYDDEIEFGYGNNMDESTKIREDIKVEKIINKKKIDNKSFNDIFNSKVPINVDNINQKSK